MNPDKEQEEIDADTVVDAATNESDAADDSDKASSSTASNESHADTPEGRRKARKEARQNGE